MSLAVAETEISFQSAEHRERIRALIEEESLLDAFSGTERTGRVKTYLVTEYGTVACLLYDLNRKLVVDVQVTGYIKAMICFKIKRIVISEALDVCMLIEHDCLCQIRLW